LQKYELKHGNTLLVLYFDNIDVIGVCPQVQAIRQKFVDNLKPSPIKVYDYYKLGKFADAYKIFDLFFFLFLQKNALLSIIFQTNCNRAEESLLIAIVSECSFFQSKRK
jgi:hypothetical protein